jgi:hypothetical protein
MKTATQLIRTTIVFGLICGLSFVPLVIGIGYIVSGLTAFCLTLWLYLAAYGLLMVRWSKKRLTSVVFPLLLALITIFGVNSISAFLWVAMGIFSWIRSGICYPTQFKIRFIAEALLCFGAGALVGNFAPISPFNWAIAIWMFFLVQALYFVLFEDPRLTEGEIQRDAFEQARQQAEKILSAGL